MQLNMQPVLKVGCAIILSKQPNTSPPHSLKGVEEQESDMARAPYGVRAIACLAYERFRAPAVYGKGDRNSRVWGAYLKSLFNHEA